MAIKIKKPTIIEPAGNKPKVIKEFIGLINSSTENISIAQMESASGWTEPGQTPAFDEYTIVLSSAGDKKINVIKEIRAVTSLGLKEAKDLVEGAPKDVKSGVNKKEAEEIKAKLEAAGAKVELK